MESSEIQKNSPEISAKTMEILAQERELQREVSNKIVAGDNGDDLIKAGFNLHDPLVKEGVYRGLTRIVDEYDYKNKPSMKARLDRVDMFGLDEQERQTALVRMATRFLYIDGPSSIDEFVSPSLIAHHALKIIELRPEIAQTPELKQKVRDLIDESWHINSSDVNKQLVDFIQKIYPEGIDLNPQKKEDTELFKSLIHRTENGYFTDIDALSPVVRHNKDFFVSENYIQAAKRGYCHKLTMSPTNFEGNESLFKKFEIDESFKDTIEYKKTVIEGYKNVIASLHYREIDDLKRYEFHYGLTDEVIYSEEIENFAIDIFTSQLKEGNTCSNLNRLLSDSYHFPEIKLKKKEIKTIISNRLTLDDLSEDLIVIDKVTPESSKENLIRRNPFVSKSVAEMFISEINRKFGRVKDYSSLEKISTLIDSKILDKKHLKTFLENSLREGNVRTEELTILEVEELYKVMGYFELDGCYKLATNDNWSYDCTYSQQFAPQTLEEFYKIDVGNMPQGMKMGDLCLINDSEYRDMMKSNLTKLTSLSFREEIIPVINAQGDAAFHYISKMRQFHSSNENDIDGLHYVAFVGKKYGVEAANIYENLLSKINDLGKKKDSVERYLSEIHLPSQKIFEQYYKAEESGNWQEVEKIKEKVSLFSHQIYYGIADEKSYGDELFLVVDELVFPIAVTALHQNVEQIYSKRQDRRADVPQSLDPHQYENISIETGKFLLGEQKLDVSPWSEVEKITQEVNEEYRLKQNQTTSDLELANRVADFYLNGRGQNWPWSQRYRDLYSHFLSQGNEPFEKFDLSSREGLLGVTEFLEETIKVDVLQKVTDSLNTSNPEKYKQLENRVLSTTKSEWNKDVSLIKNLVNIIKKQKDEAQKQSTINRLESTLQKYDLALNDVTQNDDSWMRFINAEIVTPTPKAEYRTENYYNSPEFLSAQDRFEEKRDTQRKTVDRLSNSLFKEATDKMHIELAKFKFVNDVKKETKQLEFIVSKKKEHCLAGLNMGVCVTPDEQLWNDSTFMNCIFLDQNSKKAQGGVHFLVREEYLTLPGINPSISLLGLVNREKLFDQIINYSKEVAKTLGLKGVLIPTNKTIQSNRDQIQTVIANKKYPKIMLQKEAQFSYSPHKYSFQECYVV